ncbi:hypothetical protein V8E36_000017 [Tilletia maclaganii]
MSGGSSSNNNNHQYYSRPPAPAPPRPPPGHRAADHGAGPVQALAQVYFRPHGRTQSEQLHLPNPHHQHQHAHSSSTSGSPHRLPQPVSLPPSASTPDELAERFGRLGSIDTSAHTRIEPSPPSPLKPLPALPPARTPSQHRHQQQNQSPYVPSYRPASATSLHNIREYSHLPPPPAGPSAPLRQSAYAFPEPSMPGSGTAYTPLRYQPTVQAQPAYAPQVSSSSSSGDHRRPLPRPPLLFPEPMGHMPPPAHLTPSRLPAAAGPSRPHSAGAAHADARLTVGPSRLDHSNAGQQRPPLPSRPHSNTEVTHRPQWPASSSSSGGRPTLSSSAAPSTSSAPPYTPARRPIHLSNTASSGSSPSHSPSAHSMNAASPSRTGLRAALPPPLPGQCWGIKRDGTRCTRKVGKQGGNESTSSPTSSPKRTPKQNKADTSAGGGVGKGGKKTNGTKSAGSSPAGASLGAALGRKKTGGASRTRLIVLSDSEDDDDDDDWPVHDSSDDESSSGRPGRARAGSAVRLRERGAPTHHLLAPPREQRRHRRSRSAGNDHVPINLRRDFRSAGPSADDRDDDDDSEPLDRALISEPAYCFQHISEINKSPGFYIPRTEGGRHANPASSSAGSEDLYVSFDAYLTAPDGSALGAQTQASLRSVMSAPLSVADLGGGPWGHGGRRGSEDGGLGGARGRGYMYIYELRDFSSASEICLKVGRTSNVFRRMGEWRGQCRRRGAGLILIGFEPSPQHGSLRNDTHPAAAQGVIGGAAEVWCEGIYGSHKWERLIHLELLDIGHRLDEGPCSDCGARHREIFMIPRHSRGQGQQPAGRRGRQDDSTTVGAGDVDAIEVVRQIVRKWEGFVRRLVGE